MLRENNFVRNCESKYKMHDAWSKPMLPVYGSCDSFYYSHILVGNRKQLCATRALITLVESRLILNALNTESNSKDQF